MHFEIPRVVVNETQSFGGSEDFLRSRGVEVIEAAHDPCIRQMKRRIAEHSALWNENIME